MFGRLFVISGPSGAGKGTICSELMKTGKFDLSVSMTTRAMREGEVDGESYFFVSKEQFEQTIKDGGLLEYTQIYGNYYGTPKAYVMEKLSQGKDILLEIEMEGASNIKRAYNDAVLIFVLPPNLKVLKERLSARGTDSSDQIALRSSAALDEIARVVDYDYFVINDDLDKAVSTVKDIIAGNGKNNMVGPNAVSIVLKYKEEE